MCESKVYLWFWLPITAEAINQAEYYCRISFNDKNKFLYSIFILEYGVKSGTFDFPSFYNRSVSRERNKKKGAENRKKYRMKIIRYLDVAQYSNAQYQIC